MRVRVLVVVAAGLLAGALLVPASPAEQPPRARAEAAVVSGTLGTFLRAVATDGDSGRKDDAVVEKGVAAASTEASVRTSVEDGDAVARAVAVARSVSLLDGVVTAYGVRRRATVTADRVSYSGEVRGLRIGDRWIGDVERTESYSLPGGAGTVTVNRYGRGLRVKLDKAVGAFPPDTDVTVAHVRGRARDGADPAEAEERQAAAEAAAAKARKQRRAKAQRKARRQRGDRRRLLRQGFTFPVYGKASVADDFGAARQIGAHQGNDVFADFGAPVLAVADGTINRVGTLPISGNRLWIKTDRGDSFFYAHLSAFSPAAVNGRRVKAGTLLGFVGNTGDAEPTPPHVHFEIHPRDARAKPGGEPPGETGAIDPYSILQAWSRRASAASGAWLERYGADTGARPGALVEVRDFIAQGAG